jgi:glutathione S-transferase
MSSSKIVLVSHHLCPYVQRAAIALMEKDVDFGREYIDLSNKPAWFARISPLGKVPLLRVGDEVIFESAAIVEYLEDTQLHPLHPNDPIRRARHRGWIEYASSVLNGIGGLYNAPDEDRFEERAANLRRMFETVDAAVGDGRWFDGNSFSLVDAAFAPVFRYFAVFDRIGDFGILSGLNNTGRWRRNLAERPSVKHAAVENYEARLMVFLAERGSHMSGLMSSDGAENIA